MKKRYLFLFILLLPSVLFAKDLNFSWTHDTPENVSGYNFYARKYPDVNFLKVWSGQEQAYLFNNVKAGDRFAFAVTAFNEYGESLKSREIVYVIEKNITDFAIPVDAKTITIIFK